MFETKRNAVTKWLQIIFFARMVSMINSVISVIPAVPSMLTTWISGGIVIVVIFCIYQLRTQNEHYKKATAYRAAMIASSLAGAYIFQFSVLTLVSSILSILAVYQEYSAHSELIQERDSQLAEKWHSLFDWGIVAGVLVPFGTMVTAVLAAVSGLDISSITAVVLVVLSIPQLVVDGIYLLYLKKMVTLLEAA